MTQAVTVDISGPLAVVTIDNPPVNATSTAVRAGLMEAVATVADAPVTAAILRCAGRTFVAGGDMAEFDSPAEEPHLPDVITAIEACRVPWIVALHGTVLGGGFEIAMGCAFRIAAPGTRFGLPEVNVGLVPGAGGTQRLPRLIGVEEATRLATTGAMITAEALLPLGGLDAIAEDPLDAARRLAATLPPRPTPVSQRPVEPVPDGFFPAHRAALKTKSRGQQSPLHNLDAVQWACRTDFATGQPRERALHLELRKSAESRALRHAFFAERAVARPAALADATPREIGHIAVLGGGLMGAGIAFACLMARIPVRLIERDEAALTAARDRLMSLATGAAKRGKIADPADVLDTLRLTTDMGDAADADLAIEAIFEDLSAKQDAFARLAAALGPDAILATNTSYLDPTEIFEGIPNPGRCIGLHFFSPAHVMKLLEVVRLPETAPETIATGFALARRLRKVAVLSGICDGFIGNRMLAAYRRQADYMLADGASPTQIDAAMRAFGFPMGPYELQDLTGLQIAWANRKRQTATRAPTERYVTIADRLCEMGRFGQRSGAGWYAYTDGNRTPLPDEVIARLIAEEPGTRQDFTDEEITARLLAVLVNEGARILEEGIAERPLDVDMVQIHGYAFPRWRGGPMHWADATGLDTLRAAMDRVEAQSPDSWHRSDLLS